MRIVDWMAAFVVLFLLSACSFSWPGARNHTLEQLPTLSGYRQFEGADLGNKITSNQILDVVLLGRPELAAVAELISQAAGCAQEQGVVNWRAYVSEADPAAAGVVVIASQKQAGNLQVLLQCSAGLLSRRSVSDISPCSANFRYSTADDTYYVSYAASKQQVCAAFEQALPDAE